MSINNGMNHNPNQPNTRSLIAFQAMVSRGHFLVLDTETTGLHDGEICQIAIIDDSENVLLDTLVRPSEPIPPDATRLHGINDAMVVDAPGWAQVQPQVRELLRGQDVVVYNATYDRKMMHKSDERVGLEPVDYKREATYWDAMALYAEYWGDWHDNYHNYRWQRLTVAAAQQGVRIANAHNALGDCMMTLEIARKMAGI